MGCIQSSENKKLIADIHSRIKNIDENDVKAIKALIDDSVKLHNKLTTTEKNKISKLYVKNIDKF